MRLKFLFVVIVFLSQHNSLYSQSIFGNLFKFEKSISDISKKASPSVVTIGNIDYTGNIVSHGSGFIVRENGVIVTNYHVIEKANNLLVKLHTGEKYYVSGIIFMSADRDIAVLKINVANLPFVTIGESKNLEVGAKTIAIGSPMGLEGTVSSGIISQIRPTNNLSVIQTTTPITYGSSGGPLLNMYGEVIGINTSIYEGNGSIGFAIPIHQIQILRYDELPIQLSMHDYSILYGSKPPKPKPAPQIPNYHTVDNNTPEIDKGTCCVIGILSLLLLMGLMSG
jgi:S1-C subfamily serine protease